VLRDLLSFLPNPNGGGIFQFPLERVSPRIKRGPNQDIDIPYITPSLLELEDQVALASGLNGEPGSGQVVPSVVLGYGESNTDTSFYVAAPWRSLIYRNVDAPFTFAQDYALYPHMPMNAPGFDIRAPRLFAEWMLSIPARLSPGLTPGVERSATAQVYAEVKPGESDYATASDEARVRLDLYRNGGKSTFDYFADQATTTSHSTQFLNYRYASYAPDDRDIIDHGLALPGADHTPRDLSGLPSEYAQQAAACAAISSPSCTAALSPDGVPDRPHWVVTDITDVPPPWSPRRTDWADVLVHHNPDALNSPEPQREQQLALDLLGSMTLTASLRSFLETSIPFGLWKDNPGCDWGAHSVRKVSEYPAAEQWSWMQAQGVSADARVYTQTFGEAVFGEICINCHGPKFDSRGLQSDNLLLITGGETRVANLRDGLFGPANKPGNYRAPIFGPYATNEVSTNDWAARYTAWMALGGTKAKIDPVILRLVGNALVLGAKRPSTATGDAQDANMLSNARALCNQTEGRLRGRALPFNAASGRLDTSGVALGLIESNGDAELWRRLCAFENTRPIYVLSPVHTDSADYLQPRGYHFPAGWPAEALLGDQLGSQQALASTNHFPWCVNAPKTADETTALNAIVQDKRGGRSLPLCASTWLQKPMTDSDLDRWATRGAINAGFAVFLHLDARARRALAGQVEQPPYDRCEDWTN
jgi:mono/diheme cytochrome c family protein